MIGILVVDDHPAVRAGLAGLLRSEPGLVCLATADTAAAGLEAARRLEPAVVLVDYGLPDHDGLTLCSDLKALPNPPRVLVYSAFARPRLVPAAAVAGADAMLDKGAPAEELFETIRRVARGAGQLPDPPREVIERSFARLGPEEIVLLGMAINGAPPDEIAAASKTHLDDTRRQLRTLLGRLQGGSVEQEVVTVRSPTMQVAPPAPVG